MQICTCETSQLFLESFNKLFNCKAFILWEKEEQEEKGKKGEKKEHRSKFAFSAIVLFLSRSLVENGGHEEAGKREVFNLKTRLKVEKWKDIV